MGVKKPRSIFQQNYLGIFSEPEARHASFTLGAQVYVNGEACVWLENEKSIREEVDEAP